MPLPSHQHSSSGSDLYDNRYDYQEGTSGMYQSGQDTPAGNLRISTSGTQGTGSSDNSNQHGLSGGHTFRTNTNVLTGNKSNSSAMSTPANPNISHNYDISRRAPASFSRQNEELHIPPSYATMGQQGSRDQAHQGSYHSYDDPQKLSTSTGQPLPGALQPGSSRPGPSSAITAPSAVPTLPQLSTQPQSYQTPSRATTVSHAHSYSRSSPAGVDQQKYVPFVHTPEDSKFASPTTQRYTASQTPQGGSSYSPLGLADIRPRADSGMSDGPPSANPYSSENHSSTPTNCNYLAPWAVYAFDWCKWPVQHNGLGDSAGKMAIGSYLEDSHNFVSIRAFCDNTLHVSRQRLKMALDTNPRNSSSTRFRI